MYSDAVGHHHHHAYGLFLFLLVFVIVFLILSFYNPRYVRNKVNGHTTEVNNPGLVFLWSIFISFIVLFILAVLYWCFRAC